MPDSAMRSVKFDRYFMLLEKLVPVASGFVVCDPAGTVVASHGEPAACQVSNCRCAAPGEYQGILSDEDVRVYVKDDGSTVIRSDITGAAGDLLGALMVHIDGDCSVKSRQAIHAFSGSITTAASCIARELELNGELDAMAQELAGRYEELNLVYETNDDIVEYQHEDDIIRQVLNNCVEYLGVSMVALILPGQDKFHYAVSESDPVSDPYVLIQHFSASVEDSIKGSDSRLIINDIEDRQRKALSLDIPYKILVAPVRNVQGAVVGMLVCLNQLEKPDFFNSDKNLLDVISRKLSKIIQANHDVMTGLVNHQAFRQALDNMIESSRPDGVPGVYLNIDIDQLSVINDTMGRQAGDRAILDVASLLKDRLRATDTIGYLSEGHFGILLEMCTAEQGVQVAENICTGVSSHNSLSGDASLELSVSIGMALIGPDMHDADAAFEAAELARDAAKSAGRNQVKVYSHDNSEMAERKQQMQWVARIQKAMRDDLFLIYCQDILPTGKDNNKYHFEILLRMAGEDGEVILPGEFIPTAENYNLMSSLDRWVIEKTFVLLNANGLAQHTREGLVSINISGQSLNDEGLVEFISEMFSRYALVPDCVCFEITETAAFGNLWRARDIIERVRDLGCHFSLDDFGAGLSSFSYLKELPVDYLKIDGSFVRKITTDRISHAMVVSINQIGHVMGLRTVAEFVEDEQIRQQLELIGVDYLQGYALGKPLSLEEYIAEMRLTSVSRAG